MNQWEMSQLLSGSVQSDMEQIKSDLKEIGDDLDEMKADVDRFRWAMAFAFAFWVVALVSVMAKGFGWL